MLARAYSLDQRKRVVVAVAARWSCRSLTKKFIVSIASIVKAPYQISARS
jgi:transposase